MAKRRAKGEGSFWLNKSDGRWKAQITVNRQRIGKSAKTQKEVIDWLTEQNFKIKSGILVDGNQIRIEDFLNRYLKDVARHSIRPTTFTAYSNLVRLHINPVIGNIFTNSVQIKFNPSTLKKYKRVFIEELFNTSMPCFIRHLNRLSNGNW